MRYFIAFTILLAISSASLAQSYLGKISRQVNFRAGPGTEHKTIKSLKQGTQVFIISSEPENEFYNIIEIETNKEGYVHKSYILFETELPKNSEGIFNPNGSINSYNAEIEIFNNTSKTLTLRLNRQVFTFRPKEKKTLAISPGSYEYIASAPSVVPDYGSETLNSNSAYTWEFYIVTRYK